MSNSDEAVEFIKTHCSHMGSYHGDFSPHMFLARVADEMTSAPHTDLFPDRYKEHVAYAMGMVACHRFREPPAAIAAVYLATRFEFYFRLLSGKLKGDGTWLNEAFDKPAAIAALGKTGLKQKCVSNVAVTYKLMKLNHARPAAHVFSSLDKAIFPTRIVASSTSQIADIGDRIAFSRHSAGHGLWGDISSEAVFYGLVTAIVFYNQS